ncbi:MAG: hypothetical protein JXB45_00225 [Candidatus Krumholzibacteriota bacterium]|nr:hypothetical protein [Candidatus Krumholzibacteriota bacterium]
MSRILFGIALACVIWGVVSAIAMAGYIARRGHKINILFFRLLIFKYIHQYAEITTQERGKPGGWFYSYITSMNLALVFVIIGAVLK